MTFAEKIIKDMGLKSTYHYPVNEGWLISLIEAIEKRILPQWQSVKMIPQPKEGTYWVLVDGILTTASVNYERFEKGFWRYADHHDNKNVYPTHYFPYNEGKPKIPVTIETTKKGKKNLEKVYNYYSDEDGEGNVIWKIYNPLEYTPDSDTCEMTKKEYEVSRLIIK